VDGVKAMSFSSHRSSGRFPPAINVNKAAAKDLEALLTPKDAEATIQYRESKGAFKTIEDLKRFPGIDPVKLESVKQQREFQ
jgi:competence protein ComEA